MLISGSLVALSILGVVLQFKEINANAAGIQQEDRIYIGSKQKQREKQLKNQMESALKISGINFKFVNYFDFDGPVSSRDFNNINEFKKDIFKLGKGNHMLSIGRVYVYIKIL